MTLFATTPGYFGGWASGSPCDGGVNDAQDCQERSLFVSWRDPELPRSVSSRRLDRVVKRRRGCALANQIAERAGNSGIAIRGGVLVDQRRSRR